MRYGLYIITADKFFLTMSTGWSVDDTYWKDVQYDKIVEILS